MSVSFSITKEDMPTTETTLIFKRRFRQDFAGTLIVQGGLMGIGAFTGICAARLLGPHGRGELAALTLWPLVLIMLASLGINQAIVFYTGKQSYSLSELWTASTLIGFVQSLCVVLVGVFVIPLALRDYSPGIEHLALAFLFAAPFLMMSGYPGNLLQGRLELRSFNLIRMIPSLVYALGLAVLLVLGRADLRDVVFSQILGYVLAVAAGYSILQRKEKLRFSMNAMLLKSMFGFGWRTQLGTVTSYINQRIDQLLLSLFVNPLDLGLYVVAVTVSTALGFFPQALAIVTLARGSNLPPAQARAFIGRAFRTSLIWQVVSCSALFVVAPGLIRFVFGSKFTGSGIACRILLPGSIALGLNQVLYEGARSLNEPALPAYTEGFASLITCGGLYVLLPRIGFVGAAIASTLAYTASLIFMLTLYKFRLRMDLHDLLGITTVPRSARRY